MGSLITWKRALFLALAAGALAGTAPAFAQANEQFIPVLNEPAAAKARGISGARYTCRPQPYTTSPLASFSLVVLVRMSSMLS